MDEDLAETMADLETPAERRVPELAVSEATPEVQLLLQVVSLLQMQIQQRATKRIPWPPLPRIRTAARAVTERRRRQHRGRLTDLVATAQARYQDLLEQGIDPNALSDDGVTVDDPTPAPDPGPSHEPDDATT